MNRLATLITIFVFCHFTLSSQTSLKEDIIFSSQAEIDNFQINNPYITQIDGNVTIEGSYIYSLSGLCMLTSIDGTLCIQKNNSLSSLIGLDSLEHVENLIIKNNDKLVNLRGLGSLSIVNGYVHIWYNDLLINLSGLGQISHIGSDLMIEGNYAQVDCAGLESLKSIGGSLVVGCIAGWMHHNRSLKSLTGLENLINVEDFLWINCNDSITTLDGLDRITSVGKGLIINDNKCLVNLTGLESLESCGGCLIIGGWGDCSGNPVLESLQGIENIDPESVSELKIRNNPKLTSCAIKSICNFIQHLDAIVEIEDNADGCNSMQEVEIACGESSLDEEIAVPKLASYPNPFIDLATIEYDLNEPSAVEIKIYNNIGVEIKTIHEKQLLDHHTIIWDASNLTAGVYYCKLKTNTTSSTNQTLKMIKIE